MTYRHFHRLTLLLIYASPKENVKYQKEKGYAVLVRLTDHVKGWSGKYVYVNKCAYDFLRKSSLVPGDIVIANVGDPGKVFRVPDLGQPMTLGPNSVLVKPKMGIDKGFFSLFFQSGWGQDLIRKIITGTAQKKFNKTGLRSIVVPLAPLNEQKRIVDKVERLFSALDEGETLLKTVQKQLATYRQSVLKSAVTGELTQDWRKKNKHRLSSGEDLLQRILKSRRENWKGRGKYKEPKTPDTSKLPDLPDRWVWANPEQLKSSVSNSLCIGPFGSNLKVSDYTNSGVPLIFVRHIRAKQFDGLKPRFVSEEKAQELSSHRVVGGDLLVTKMGEPPGEVCIYPGNNGEAIITADCIRFSPNKALLNTEYLELSIGSQVVQHQIRKITKGVAQQKVTLANFRAIAIPLAGLDEQKQIADICSDIFSQIEALETWCSTELTRSGTLRQSILKDAFSGKLVPQNPADEPASELLKHIQAERDQQPKPKTRKGKKRVNAS